jgi:hypothetical protein
MNWWLIGFGVLCAVIAAICLWFRNRTGRELALMAATATSKAADVASLAPGTVVEVKGNLRCQSPLTAEFSKRQCVYFLAEINREEVYYERDSQGRSQRRTRNVNIHTNKQFAPCVIEDGSGQVGLKLEGADIEGEQVVNRRESEPQGVGGVLMSLAAGRRDVDLVHTETILAPGIPLYVLGEVQPDRSVGKPAAGSVNKIFVVSRKSEEERNKSLTSTMFWLLVAAIVLLAGAAALVIWGVSLRSA